MAFRTFRTQAAADVFAKNAEMQGYRLFCGNPDVLGEPAGVALQWMENFLAIDRQN